MTQGKKHERSLTDEEIAAVLKARQGTRLSTKYQDIYRAVFRKRAMPSSFALTSSCVLSCSCTTN